MGAVIFISKSCFVLGQQYKLRRKNRFRAQVEFTRSRISSWQADGIQRERLIYGLIDTVTPHAQRPPPLRLPILEELSD